MKPRVTTNGKQVLLDGQHLADGRDTDAAEVIAIVLNTAVLPCATPVEDVIKFRDLFA